MTPEMGVTACKMAYNEPILQSSTIRPRVLIRRLYRQLGAWRAVSDLLGHSPAYWYNVATGKRRISREAEDALRFWLRLPPKYARRIDRMSVDDLARYMQTRCEIARVQSSCAIKCTREKAEGDGESVRTGDSSFGDCDRLPDGRSGNHVGTNAGRTAHHRGA